MLLLAYLPFYPECARINSPPHYLTLSITVNLFMVSIDRSRKPREVVYIVYPNYLSPIIEEIWLHVIMFNCYSVDDAAAAREE